MEDIQLIRSFVTTVTNQSNFSAAARTLEVTPAAISKNVKRLEEALGVRLFSRSTRALHLTDEGRLIYTHYASALHSIDKARSAATSLKDELSGVVRITMTSAFSRFVILPLLSELLRKHPQIKLDIKLDDHLTDMIKEGFDIGIRGGRAPRTGRFVARRLAPLQLVACGSPTYFSRRSAPIYPDELNEHNCIRWRNPHDGKLFPWQFEVNGRVIHIPVCGQLIFDDLDAVTEAGLRGDGLVMIGVYRAAPLIKAGLMQAVLEQFSAPPRYYYIHYPTRKFLAPRTRLVLDFLINNMPSAQSVVS